MRILILGGSNSLMSDGYVRHLHQALQEHTAVEIRQLSVGGTTSLAAVGRLLDTFRNEQFDFVLYEYSINDFGHFSPRPDCARSYLLCLHLIIKVAADLYPSAIFVPLVLAPESHFCADARSQFHESQLSIFSALALPFIDIRRWMSDLFMGRKPAWMYADPAHYSAPYATSIIGSFVAARLLKILSEGAAPLRSTYQTLLSVSPFASLSLAYLFAGKLVELAAGPVQREEASNRLMQVDYLRMHPGSRLAMRTNMFPLALYLKSDARHALARVSIHCDSGPALTAQIGTRHTDTEQHAFICTNVPLPLVFGPTLAIGFGPTTFELSVPAAADPTTAVVDFDLFSHVPTSAESPHLDVIGVLLVGTADGYSDPLRR
jgi:hypothetical protein